MYETRKIVRHIEFDHFSYKRSTLVLRPIYNSLAPIRILWQRLKYIQGEVIECAYYHLSTHTYTLVQLASHFIHDADIT